MGKDFEYDARLDEVLAERQVEVTSPFSKSGTKYKFLVRIMSYDGGKDKLEIKRLQYGRDHEGKFLKLGRLSRHELDLLLPVISELHSQMNK